MTGDAPNGVAPPPEALVKLLEQRDLSFREFVEFCLYDERHGYYTAAASSRARHRDFITAPAISPLFAWTIVHWVRKNFPSMEDRPSAIVDVGCGDGGLLASIASHLDEAGFGAGVRLIGIDRGLGFVPPERRSSGRITFSESVDAIPSDRPVVVICNELFDAIPFSRVVMRESGLAELFVTLSGESLDWSERPATEDLERYFERRGVRLAPGQFADITPEWRIACERIASRISEGFLLVFDYGYDKARLFDNRVRRFGTAAAYSGHQVHRDLLARPGGQDLTCHVNFDDLIDAGAGAGMRSLAFTRLARFLLDAGAAAHPLFSQPVAEGLAEALKQREARESARRLILPDGIGDEMRVLVLRKSGSSTGSGA